MNNKRLNEILKSARVPERAGDYWEKFPGRVMAKLHWRQQNAEARQLVGSRVSSFRLLRLPVFGAGLAVVCILLGFGVGFWKGRQSIAPERAQLAEALKCYREIAGLFPN